MEEPPREFRLLGRKKHYSGAYCTAGGCTNSSGYDKYHNLKRSYYTYPLKDKKRLKQWLKADPRKEWFPTKNNRICSDHFKGGVKTNLPGTVGYIPTEYTNVGKKQPNPRASRTSQRAAQYVPPPPTSPLPPQPDALPSPLGRPANPKPAQDNTPYKEPVWRGEHDYTKTQLEHGPPTLVQAQALRIEQLEHELAITKGRTISLQSIDDSEFFLWTNLPSRGVFNALLTYIEDRGAATMKVWRGACTAEHPHYTEKGLLNKPGPQRALSVADELFLVLVKLKTGLTNVLLERLFGISDTTIGRVFTTYVNFLSVEFKYLFEMPDVNDSEDVPECFKPFVNLRTIIDCTEVKIETASDLQSRKELYSNYKGGETVKFLVGMSPHLYVNYVSEAWGGRASDKHITLASETLLDSLPLGSMVMTDRGFDINEELQLIGVKLIIPDFKGRGRSQISNEELARSENIAEARIHIERIIQRIRTFHILDTRFKLSMQDILEQTFTCCAYLANFQSPIIKS